MLYEVTLHAIDENDRESYRVREEYNLLTGSQLGYDLIGGNARGYLLEGDLSEAQIETLLGELLVDPLLEKCVLRLVGEPPRQGQSNGRTVTVLLKPGVMDPVADSVLAAAGDLGIPLVSVGTFRRYSLSGEHLSRADRSALHRVLANDAIERIIEGPLTLDHLTLGQSYNFRLITVPLRDLDDAGLQRVSRAGQLSLALAEMRTIQEHFRGLSRDPTDVELETLAQTWSEHCSHKTLKGQIDFSPPLAPYSGRGGGGEGLERDPAALAAGSFPPLASLGRGVGGEGATYRIDNLLKQTIFGATQELRRRMGSDDWCVSVFEDNAGVVRFDEKYNVCFKVETHNHPSAIEPYGGANTGVGGVIRDPLGTGLGAKPICNTDVFCFAPPDYPAAQLPPGVLHPAKVLRGVVAGVRDYGNRMGIPTVNGAVCFDERYLGNPLVYCGTVGLIPVDRCHKQTHAGDLIVAVGGRTGRDGIHGATFSSVELTAESDKVSGGAVQIGNAITEKKVLDVLLQARDRGLYRAITDCGAGGFSSAVGEMGAELGARVDLDKAPLKYQGLSYTEIWISEAQERMVLAVPTEKWPKLQQLCASEGVEATVLGEFEATGQLRLFYQGEQVADLGMAFLHDGRPQVVRQATWSPPTSELPSPLAPGGRGVGDEGENLTATLLAILRSWNVCSKETIVRQYDHEVQGGTVIKPLVGVNEGPGDAAVITPILGSWRGLAVGCGICPQYGDLDPYQMAAHAIDEAVRNVVAVGADPARIALLDNFCWGNTDRPEVLGSLVLAAQACRDVALAYGMPFISGKDSLKNEFHSGDRHIVIPPTLLISALGQVPDVRRCVTMDLKEIGSVLYLVGRTTGDLGGSHYHLVHGLRGGRVPPVDLTGAPVIFRKLHAAISAGLVRACHDLSEGGLAVALAEMAFAGGMGADITNLTATGPGLADACLLFGETPTRFVVEVPPGKIGAFEAHLGQEVPFTRLGHTVKESRLRIVGGSGEWVIWAALQDCQEAWRKPLQG